MKSADIVYADILSQAITGELVGMANYAAMVRLHRDAENQCSALMQADSELQHSRAFRRVADELALFPIVNPAAPYWQRVRAAFLRQADAADVTACVIAQEVMLESMAVSLYQAVAEVAPAPLATVFNAIGREEESHLQHAIEFLQPLLAADRDGFERRLEAVHDDVMTSIASMLGEQDSAGHCELCQGECVKASLGQIGLDRATLRGRTINQYLRTLDHIGVRGEQSLAWVARLPV